MRSCPRIMRKYPVDCSQCYFFEPEATCTYKYLSWYERRKILKSMKLDIKEHPEDWMTDIN